MAKKWTSFSPIATGKEPCPWRSGWMVIETTGKAGTSINPDGKAGIGQGFTNCQHTATEEATGYRRKPSRYGKARPLPSAPRARLHDLARAFQPQGHGTSERNPALGRSGWTVIEVTGMPEPRSSQTARPELGRASTVCQHTATKQGTGDRRKPSRSGRARPLPLAPRARLHDLARAFQPSRPQD